MNHNNNKNLGEPLINKYINNTSVSSENNNNKKKKIKRKKSKELRNMATGGNISYQDISSSKMLG